MLGLRKKVKCNVQLLNKSCHTPEYHTPRLSACQPALRCVFMLKRLGGDKLVRIELLKYVFITNTGIRYGRAEKTRDLSRIQS